jgi:hypothetical protein
MPSFLFLPSVLTVRPAIVPSFWRCRPPEGRKEGRKVKVKEGRKVKEGEGRKVKEEK